MIDESAVRKMFFHKDIHFWRFAILGHYLNRHTLPPFGLATITFLGLSSYMLLIGIYSSAISVAEDTNLRRSIRDFTLRQSRLLDSIGSAEAQQELERRVMELTKQNQDRMVEETGIQSSFSEEDMKQYLRQVISEIEQLHKHD